MRLFTAVALPDVVRRHLEKLQGLLSTRIDRDDHGSLTMSPRENLHVTLKFFGDVPDDRLDELRSALQRVIVHPMTLCVDRFLVFPPRGPAHVVAAGLAMDVSALAALHEDIEAATSGLELRRETRRYVPHVTLGRSRGGLRYPGQLSTQLLNDLQGPVFEARSFDLINSTLTPTGPTYETLATYG
jgi:RNA 2',3'-cyclic 3'-phosphodiesterase